MSAERAYDSRTIDRCAQIARTGCLVPPDDGSPTDDEARLCDAIARQILALHAEHLRMPRVADGLLQEYNAAYAQAVGHAADQIWQAIKRGPTPAPDWVLRDLPRPGGFMWNRGDQREPLRLELPGRQLDWT